MLTYLTIGFGTALGIFGILTVKQVASFLGADELMLDICTSYGRVVLVGVPFVMLQFVFQSFFVIAEKPQLSLYSTLAAGCMNMILDVLFVGAFHLGVEGAAVATVMSQVVGGGFPLIYFSRKNSSLLRLGKTSFDGKALLKTLGNGSSEFVSNISMSVVGMLYNVQLMKYSGENGVAAYGVLMYVNIVFLAIFIGFQREPHRLSVIISALIIRMN